MTVSVLEIKYNYAGKANTLYLTVLHNSKEVVLVDCGYPGFMPLIEAAMHQHGLSLAQLTGIIITHADIDHVGGLFEIKEKYPHIKVYSSALGKSYINGKEKSPRLVQAEQMQPTLPEDKKEWGLQFMAALKAIPPVPVDGVFEDNDEPFFLPGVQIIYTPGHMPGHISLYVKESKTCIAADAVVVENGVLEIGNPQFTLDIQQAIASVKKLEALDIEKMVCYHGGVVEKGIKRQLRKLVEKYERG